MLLLGLGLVCATGYPNLLAVLPAAALTVVGGALTAYGWTRWLGERRLRSIARRLHLGAQFDRTVVRVRSADARHVALSRLIPGLRIYTSMVAGATRVPAATFTLGAVAAVPPWVVFYLLLGFFVGVPAQHLLGAATQLATRAGVAVGIAAALVLALHHLRPALIRPRTRRASGLRWAAALGIDLATITLMTLALALVSRALFGFSGTLRLIQESAIFLLFAAAYIVVARRAVGMTGGEALLEVRIWGGGAGRRDPDTALAPLWRHGRRL